MLQFNSHGAVSARSRGGMLLSVAALALLTAGTAAAETKSFVISYLYDADWSDGKSDCPNGMNISAIEFYRRDLAKAGYKHDEIEAALNPVDEKTSRR